MEPVKENDFIEMDLSKGKASCPRVNGGNARCFELNCEKHILRNILGGKFMQATDDDVAELLVRLIKGGIDTCYSCLQQDLYANFRHEFDPEYGCNYNEEEIAKRLGVKLERARQLVEKTLRKLRNPVTAKKLKEFYSG